MSDASASSFDALRSQLVAVRAEVSALSEAGRADADALGAAQARAEERVEACEAAEAALARRVEELGRQAAGVPQVGGGWGSERGAGGVGGALGTERFSSSCGCGCN